MGSSTTTLQSVVDYVSNLGEMGPVIPAGGYSVATCLTMGTDVMLALINKRFNFKFNRMKIPPFYTISWQQDYAQIGSTFEAAIGWIEHGYWVDINNTALPKPSWPIETVKDLEFTSIAGNPPGQVAWHFNKELIQGIWPGPNVTYVNPFGSPTTPTNGPTNILDAHNNILVLTTYGTTNAVNTPPVLPANSPEGTTVNDGTCVWTVAAPLSQGFRLNPMPPQQTVCYQVNIVAQKKAPAPFTTLDQFIDPIPDDYANYFREGFSIECYKMAPDPNIRKMYPQMRVAWLNSIENMLKQGDKEPDSAGFIPDRSVIAPQGGIDIGPANPYLYKIYPGR